MGVFSTRIKLLERIIYIIFLIKNIFSIIFFLGFQRRNIENCGNVNVAYSVLRISLIFMTLVINDCKFYKIMY